MAPELVLELRDGGRLRVVDDDVVVAPLEGFGVQTVVLAKDPPLLLIQDLRAALDGVVDGLRDVEEFVLAEDHLPLGLEARIPHERYERVEDLRDAAAERGR